MDFCPRCGQALSQREWAGRSRPACEGCGYLHMGSWTVGVGGVVVHEGRVLLARRAVPPALGSWAIPGGYVECDETLEAAVVREVLEETAIATRVTSLTSVRSVVHPARLDTYVTFALEYLHGDVEADGVENDAAGWFTAAELEVLEGLTPFSQTLVNAVLAGGTGLAPVPYKRPGGEAADCYGLVP